MIPYARQHISNQDINFVKKILKSEYLTSGPTTIKFEKKVAEYCNAKFAVATNSATSALHIACRDFTCNDYEKVYLLGFDHKKDEYDNLYADTKHYFSKDSKISDGYIHENGTKTVRQGNENTKVWIDVHKSWTDQLYKVIKEHPALQFIWINYCGDDFPKLPNLFSKDETEIWQA